MTFMLRRTFLTLFSIIFGALSIQAQTGIIKGKIVDAVNNEPLSFANVSITGTTIGVSTDIDGNYEISIKPGLYNVEASFIGYQSKIEYEVQVTLARPRFLDFALDQFAESLDEVVVTTQNKFQKIEESTCTLNVSLMWHGQWAATWQGVKHNSRQAVGWLHGQLTGFTVLRQNRY